MTEYAVGPDGPLYLTTEEIAQRFRMTASGVRQWRHEGRGPLGVRFGKHVLYPLPEVEAWEQRQIEAAKREHERNRTGNVSARREDR